MTHREEHSSILDLTGMITTIDPKNTTISDNHTQGMIKRLINQVKPTASVLKLQQKSMKRKRLANVVYPMYSKERASSITDL